MHKEILNDKQRELLPMMSQFKRDFYLVGGTAIALYLGHRRSIDFDLFKASNINAKKILDKISTHKYPYVVTRRVDEQLNLLVNTVDYMIPNPPSNDFIKEKLSSFAIQGV